jgi:hypothetical protein
MRLNLTAVGVQLAISPKTLSLARHPMLDNASRK